MVFSGLFRRKKRSIVLSVMLGHCSMINSSKFGNFESSRRTSLSKNASSTQSKPLKSSRTITRGLISKSRSAVVGLLSKSSSSSMAEMESSLRFVGRWFDVAGSRIYRPMWSNDRDRRLLPCCKMSPILTSSNPANVRVSRDEDPKFWRMGRRPSSKDTLGQSSRTSLRRFFTFSRAIKSVLLKVTTSSPKLSSTSTRKGQHSMKAAKHPGTYGMSSFVDAKNKTVAFARRKRCAGEDFAYNCAKALQLPLVLRAINFGRCRRATSNPSWLTDVPAMSRSMMALQRPATSFLSPMRLRKRVLKRMW